MDVLNRIGVAFESGLPQQPDRLSGQWASTNRSAVLRNLTDDQLATGQVAILDAMVAGTITLIYDHQSNDVAEKLTELHRTHQDLVLSISRSHLGYDACLEVLNIQGKLAQVEQFVDLLVRLKGIQRGRLVMAVPIHAIEHTLRREHKQ
jgi:CopG family transcriptional regulator, nickel-responsive regulator